MEIKYFRLIKAIVEEGSIANSAKKLFLTQSALSHQLRELEQRLTFKVFYRSRNQWKLTEEGTALYTLGNTILRQLDNTFLTIEQLRAGTSGTIKVSTECYSFYQGFAPFIQKMGLLYPEITVDIILEATHQPIKKLLTHEIDIAIVTTKPHDESIESIEVYEDEIFAWMHHEHPLSSCSYLEAHDFALAHLIIHSFPLETVSIHQQFLKPHRVVPKKISAIPLTEIALELIDANMGIMCMPKWALKSFVLSKNIISKSIGKNGLRRTHHLAIRSSDTNKKYIQDFISNFAEDFYYS